MEFRFEYNLNKIKFLGIDVITSTGEKLHTTALLLPGLICSKNNSISAVMDLKAKAPVQYFKECTSFYGCSFCTLKGISTGKQVI